MAAESKAGTARRLAAILAKLRGTYPEAHCELNHSNPLELLVATILSAQCADKQVNRVTESLFKSFKTPGDYARAPLPELEQAIRRIGLFRNKARNIQLCCRALVERHQGLVPSTMDELTALRGVGRKTANVVLGNAFGKVEGIVVDTHVARLAGRLRLTRERTPERIEQALMQLVPRDDWTQLSHWLIWHGRRRCMARTPDCVRCELRALCPGADMKKDSKSR